MANVPIPTAATAAAQNRQQGSLRDIINSKLGPMVKQALKDTLEVDPEYPLQYLGEHLINQSLLYESNPDSTNIKARFLYNFDRPVTTTRSTVAETPTANTTVIPPVSSSHVSPQPTTSTPNSTAAVFATPMSAGSSATATAPAPHMNGAAEVYDLRAVDEVQHQENGISTATTITDPSPNPNTNDDDDEDSTMLNGVSEIARNEDDHEGPSNGGILNGLTADTEMEGTS